MFLSRKKKNNVYPCKPLFYSIKVGFKGVKIIWACFRDVQQQCFAAYELRYPKEVENINYTKVKYGETYSTSH